MAERQTLSIKEVAEILGISAASAYRAAREQMIPSLRIGSRYLVPKDAFQRFLSQSTKEVIPRPDRRAAEAEPEPIGGLAEVLEATEITWAPAVNEVEKEAMEAE